MAVRLRRENRELRARLEEAEDALRAIREGEVDAVIVTGSQGDRVFSLMETENLHRLMVETMNEMGLAISTDGLILYANDRAAALLERGRSNLLGHRIEELIAPRDLARLRRLLDDSGTGTADDRVVFRATAGAEVPVHLWASRLPRPEGSMICLVGTDLSRLEADQALLAQLRDHQQALRESRAEALELMSQALVAREHAAQSARELRESDRRKDAFLATLAHELRNPLAPIRNALEILRLAGIGTATAEEARAMMERQLAHLVRLVDDLMEVSRITHGKIDLRKEHVALATVIDTVVETARPFLELSGQRLTVELPRDPTWLEGDPVRLAQIFGNLLNNAIKYSDPGQEIQILAQPHPEGIKVTVRDAGVGIAQEMLPRLFDLFAQGPVSPTRLQGGLGIGLTLVRQLVELHGGRVEAFSAGTGQGSEMHVYLPSAQGARPASDQVTRLSGPGVAGSRGRRILVVDDNQDAARSLAQLLTLKGATVRVADDGRAALKLLEEAPSEVVILDIGMPDLDGHAVARRIRARPEWDGIRLIAMTGLGETADRQRSMAAGFDQHLIKPVPFDVLDALLRPSAARIQPPAAARTAPPLERPIGLDSPAQLVMTPEDGDTGSSIASLMHDLAQPLSSAGCYAVAARTLAARSPMPSALLHDALKGIDEQVQQASKILERLRHVLAPADPTRASD
ncbi:MAG: PAS domain-containing hybrid sensor histidine kinase/response regulator [Sphingobacteriia bacterium]|nr:PAS domain-containing hybrid sensor histidine kinase/response regulator [Sphingobacteriia bacterium]NCC40712.1 PAS domain-containing hybrid sensor histidine kinase/response regulator [Gammaproteobacteria bacterium]